VILFREGALAGRTATHGYKARFAETSILDGYRLRIVENRGSVRKSDPVALGIARRLSWIPSP
jgi:hypothetical protein